MSWQGLVRARAQGCDRLIVCTRPDRRFLYADVPHEFVPFSSPAGAVPDCWMLRHAPPGLLEAVEQTLQAYGGERLKPARLYKADEQKFLKYGEAAKAEAFDVVVHARGALRRMNGGDRSWPLASWSWLVSELLKRGLRVAAVGAPREAHAPQGAVNLCGKPLEELANTLAAAKLLVGPSSGPLHFGALCGTPLLVWTDKSVHGSVNATNKTRYETVWNPLQTPVRVLEHGWRVDHRIVLNEILAKVGGASPKPVGDVYSAHVSFWERRPEHYPAGQRESIERELSRRVNGARYEEALDLGAGSGRFIPWLTTRCNRLWAADVVPGRIDALRRKDPLVNAIQLTQDQKLPFKSPRLDLLFACLVFQHLTDDRLFTELTREVARCLKPGARVIVVDNAVDRAFHVKPRGPEALAKALQLAPGWRADRVSIIPGHVADHWLLDGRRA